MSTPVPSPTPVGESLHYKPISTLAVVGLVASGLCAALVLIAIVVALYQGAPFFYSLWLVLGPALAGLVLSLLARNQIRASEGTQAGERLATLGIWLSVVFGLGYGVYVYVSGLAVTSQANTFVMDLGPDTGFFPHLLKAGQSRIEYNSAYLLTQPATSRGSTRPDDLIGMKRTFDTAADGGPGALSVFRKHMLVRLLMTAPAGQVQIEPLGVQGWDYEDRSYKVSRLYRIKTPEVELEISLPTASTEGDTAGEPRRWYLDLRRIPRPNGKQIKLTPFGEGIDQLRLNSRRFLISWHNSLNEGKPFALAAKDTTDWERVLPNESDRGYVKGRLQDLFLSVTPQRLLSLAFLFTEESGLGSWKLTDDGKVQMTHAFKLPLEPTGGKPVYTVDGEVVTETLEPIDPVKFRSSPEVACQIHSITVLNAMPMGKKKE